MNRIAIKLGRRILLVFIMTVAISGNIHAQSERDADWDRVLSRHDKIVALQDQGAPLPERRASCREASDELLSYLRKWSPGITPISRLKGYYQLGTYNEGAFNLSRAAAYYKWCLWNSLVNTPEARYDDRAIAPLAKMRLRIVRDALQRRMPSHTIIRFESNKLHHLLLSGEFSGLSEKLQESNVRDALIDLGSQPELKPDQQAEIALRLCQSGRLEEAAKIGLTALEKEPSFRGRVKSHAEAGLVVHAVNGSTEQAKALWQHLAQMRDRLNHTYFKADDEAPVLSIYVNMFDGANKPDYVPHPGEVSQTRPMGPPSQGLEVEGRKLSQTLHFQPRPHVTGYYEALDNSIVLRHGLRDKEGLWHLGTAQHEMMHALMQAHFPLAPTWLNEGMAALYEETAKSNPLDNHRLDFLREALKQNDKSLGRFPTVAEIVDPLNEGWHDDRNFLLTAAARYFCMFLWEEGRNEDTAASERQTSNTALQNFYRKLSECKPEESGALPIAKVLEEITGKKIGELEVKWRQMVNRHIKGAANNPKSFNPITSTYMRILSAPPRRSLFKSRQPDDNALLSIESLVAEELTFGRTLSTPEQDPKSVRD